MGSSKLGFKEKGFIGPNILEARKWDAKKRYATNAVLGPTKQENIQVTTEAVQSREELKWLQNSYQLRALEVGRHHPSYITLAVSQSPKWGRFKQWVHRDPKCESFSCCKPR